MSRESVYDDKIAPLMSDVIRICKEAGIPVYASFALDGDMACTTYIAPKREEIPEDEREDFDAWVKDFGMRADRAARTTSPMMLTVRDAGGQVTRMEAIL